VKEIERIDEKYLNFGSKSIVGRPNMLWLETGAILTDIPYQKPNISRVAIY
jgi:hypothetical protein